MTNLPGSQAPSDLEHRRAYECRLTTDRALQSLEESAAFLADRGLLRELRTARCQVFSRRVTRSRIARVVTASLRGRRPSTHRRGSLRSFPASRYSRSTQERVSSLPARTLAIVDPIRRAELTRLDGGDRETRRLLGHLASGGPTTLGTLQEELGLRSSRAEGDSLSARTLRRDR